MITEISVATYDLDNDFAEAYCLEQEDRVVGIVLAPTVSSEQIDKWQTRVAEAIGETVDWTEAADGVFEGFVDGALAVTLRVDRVRVEP